MVVRLLLQQTTVGLEFLGNGLVRIKHVLPGEVGDIGKKLARIVNRDDDPDAVLAGDDLVVFTVSGCLVNDSGSFTGRNVFGDKDRESVRVFLAVGVVVKDSVVLETVEVRTLDSCGDCGGR